MMAAVGLLTACDPSKDDISMPSSSLSEQQLSDGFSFKQYDETYTQEKEDGNYYIDNKKFFLSLNGKEYRSLLQISCKL